MQDPKTQKHDPPQSPVCNLDIALPGCADGVHDESSQNSYKFLKEARNGNISIMNSILSVLNSQQNLSSRENGHHPQGGLENF